MIETRRRAYLEALGFDVWVARPPAAERGRLGLGGGQGSTLLVCPAAADSDTELARDITRTLGGDCLWAWLDPPVNASDQRLEDIIATRPITRVLLFGPEPGRCLFQGPTPETIGSAHLSLAPALKEIAVSGSARLALWHQLRNWRSVAHEGFSG